MDGSALSSASSVEYRTEKKDEQERLEMLLLDEKDRHWFHRDEVGEKLQPKKMAGLSRLAKKQGRKQKKTEAEWEASRRADNDRKRAYNKELKRRLSKKLISALQVSEANISESSRQYLVGGSQYSVGIYTPVSPSSEDPPEDPPQRRSIWL